MAFTDFSAFRFLLIDDFAHYRSMLKSILRAGGATQIDDAGNGPDGIEKLVHNHYDVVLCDYNLGDGQDGQQILEEARHRELLPADTIFIMVTAENTMAMVMGIVEYRPDGYLNKPFTKEVLRERLDRVIAQRAALDSVYKAERRGDYAAALNACDEGIRSHPKYALDFARKKGDLLQTQGEHAQAIVHYDKVIQAADPPWAQLGKAHALLAVEQDNEAEKVLRALLARDGQLIEAYDLLANALEKQGKTTELQDTLVAGTQVSPKSVTRQQRLARTALRTGDRKLAERALRATLREGKHSCFAQPDDHLALSRLYIENGDARKAMAVIKEGVAKYKKNPLVAVHLAAMEIRANVKAGNRKQAHERFRKAIDKLPDNLSELPEAAMSDFASACQELGEDEVAEALMEDFRSGASAGAKEKYAALLVNSEGVRLYKEGHIKQSISKFEQACKILPTRASVNLNAAQSLIIHMQKQGASSDMKSRVRTYLDHIRELEPGNERYIKLEQYYTRL